ncbi:MAG TPA: glycosyltransferase [Candidatus Nanoarchaeia archaeon]|nr:glycosyltransferase [Candidatus Nanoarchaeia archaeon]
MNFGDFLIYLVSYFGLYTSLFFLLTLFEDAPPKRKPLRQAPKITIAIPCFNEEHTVLKTVKSLLRLNYPQEKLDIVVVDDGSTDRTYTVVESFVNQNNIKNVRLFHKENGGKYTAMNYALERSDSVFFGLLDADSFVDKDALRNQLPYFKNSDVMAVTPSMRVHNPKRVLVRVQYVEYLIGTFLRRVFSLLGAEHVAPGPFTIYRREFFKKHGGFRKAYHTEDIESSLRIQSFNYTIQHAPDAKVYTEGVQTWKALTAQRLRWYHGFLRNAVDYKHLFSNRHGNLGLFILPAAFFSVFLVMISMFYTIYQFSDTLWRKWLNLVAVDFDIWRMLTFKWDTFYINNTSIMILSVFTLILSLYFIWLAKRLSEEKHPIKWSYCLFFLFYWLFFGYWWLRAILAAVLRMNVRWGHKTGLV